MMGSTGFRPEKIPHSRRWNGVRMQLTSNAILAPLSANDREALQAHLKPITLPQARPNKNSGSWALKDSACECYDTVKQQYRQLVIDAGDNY
jgi:hypothetical protein